MTRWRAASCSAPRPVARPSTARACSTQDGHSPLLASTNPACVPYDPAFAFEVGHIVRDGLRRMYGEDAEDIFYYLTIYNEPYVQPAEPDDLDVEGMLQGPVPVPPTEVGPGDRARSAQILASGVGLQLGAGGTATAGRRSGASRPTCGR